MFILATSKLTVSNAFVVRMSMRLVIRKLFNDKKLNSRRFSLI